MSDFQKLMESKTKTILDKVGEMHESHLDLDDQISYIVKSNSIEIPEFNKNSVTFDIRTTKVSPYEIPHGGTYSSSTVEIDIVDYKFPIKGHESLFKYLYPVGNGDYIKAIDCSNNIFSLSLTKYKKVIDNEANLEEIKLFAKSIIDNIENQFSTFKDLYTKHLERQKQLIDQKISDQKAFYQAKNKSLNKLNPFN